MSRTNPFADQDPFDDKTSFYQPQAGQQQTYSPPNSNPAYPRESEDIAQIVSHNKNPLVSAAFSLLSLVPQLQTTASHSTVDELRNKVIKEIKRFEATVQRQINDNEQIQAASYALCTVIDETVLNTPWGHQSIWATNGLLVFFHKEAFGGEKFFKILNNSLQKPEKYLNLLEFLYFCLCLGFQGRYRVTGDKGALEDIRERTYQVIQRQYGDIEKSLSLHWKGIKSTHNELSKLIPLWVIAAVTAFILVITFIFYVMALGSVSDPTYAKLAEVKEKITPPTINGVTTPPPLPPSPELKNQFDSFLKPEVDNHQVELISQSNGKIMIRIVSNGFFASGSDEVMPQYHQLLDKIGQALVDFKIEHILVVGHTDNSPTGLSLKFSNNWKLSKARAQAVAELLKANNQLNTKMDIEGRSDKAPLVANDSKEHKAMNRRVEIIL